MNFKILTIALIAVFTAGSVSSAQADISQEDRVVLQTTLLKFIDKKTVDGRFLYFDPDQKKIVEYYPANLHPMIINNGDLYFLCADFRDETGGEVEVDFIATRGEGEFQIIQTMVNNRDVIREMMKKGE